MPCAKIFTLQYLTRDLERLAIAKFGSLEALEELKKDKAEKKKTRAEAAKVVSEARKRKLDELLEKNELTSMKLPRAVQEMMRKYIRFGEEGRWAQYKFEDVSERLNRLRMTTALTVAFEKHLQNPTLRVRRLSATYSYAWN